jgi:hypothetical protein
MKSGEIDFVPSYVKGWPQAHSAIAMNGFPCYFDLTRIPFLETAEYRKLSEKNMEFDLLSIPWLSRDHGFINWPPIEN